MFALRTQIPLAGAPISLDLRRALFPAGTIPAGLFLVRKPGFAPGPSPSPAEMLLVTPRPEERGEV